MDPYSRRVACSSAGIIFFEVLDHYVSTGEAEAIFFAQQPQYEYYMQYTSIQDCILRNRYHSSYLIMSDLDERMVTGNANDTLVNLVLSIMEQHRDVGSITFWSRFVFRTADLPSIYKGESTLRDHLPTLVFDNTTLTEAEHYRKIILNPLRVLAVTIHYVKDFLGNYTNRYIPMSAGYIRHYRYPFLGAFSTSTWPIIEMSGTFQTIKYPEHLMGQLFQNVQRRLDRVYKEDLVITTRQPNKT
ncbi:hypothetical protein Q1695_002191 [Nippostrongylus brasiliensis]|nr:hypothetical protein Q1695_002191 [Nippostrongylus brasiliensis]